MSIKNKLKETQFMTKLILILGLVFLTLHVILLILGYNQATNTNAIIQSNQAQTQTILNALNNHWTESLRDKLFEASQAAQTASIVSQLKTTSTTTA